MAYGGGNWFRQILEYGSGLNERGIEKFKAGNGMTQTVPTFAVWLTILQLGRSMKITSTNSLLPMHQCLTIKPVRWRLHRNSYGHVANITHR